MRSKKSTKLLMPLLYVLYDPAIADECLTTIALQVENLQLTSSELDVELIEDELPKDQPIKQESVLTNFSIEHSVLVNSQLLDIEIKPCFNDGEIETDEELDQL